MIDPGMQNSQGYHNTTGENGLVDKLLKNGRELSENGIGEFELPCASLQAVDSLNSSFQRLDIDALFGLAHNELLTVDSGTAEPYRFVVTHSQSTQSMRWLWVGDSHTLDAFAEIMTPEVRAHLSHVAGGEVEINAACYIVVRDGVTDEECLSHYDFYSSEIARGSVFSLMTPMSVGHPSCVGGLEFWPWTGLDKAYKDSDMAYRCDVRSGPVEVMQYRYGFATVVDGRILHRTQPYRLDVRHDREAVPPMNESRNGDPMRLTAAIASGELRVLLCVNASRTTVESWPHLERLLLKQVGAGHVRGNQQFSYSKPLVEAESTAKPPKKGGFLLRKLMK